MDNDKKELTVCYTKNNTKGHYNVLQRYEEVYFIYQYENVSRLLSVPVLSIYAGKVPRAKLVEGNDWDKEVLKSIIQELTQAGIKGRITKTTQSHTNEFDYIN